MRKKQAERAGQIGGYWLSKRRNSEAWCRTWFDERARQTRRASLGTGDFRQAELKLAAWVVENAAPQRACPDDVPLETILVRYWKIHASKRRSAEQARYAMQRWSAFFPEAMASSVTPARQRAFVEHLAAQGLSSGYIRRILSVGQAALNRAQRDGELLGAPRVDLALAPEGAPRNRTATPTEARWLFAAAEQDHEWRYLLLAFGTAGRPEALLQLTSLQGDCSARSIDLNPPGRVQNKKRRPVVPMVEALVPIFYGAPPGLVVQFQGRPLGSIKTTFRRLRARARQLLRNQAAERVRQLRRSGRRGEAARLLAEAQRAGNALLELTPYVIRHTVASELRKRRVPVWEVAALLGHSIGYRTTERYAHVGPDHLAAAAAAIDGYLAELGVYDPEEARRENVVRVSSVLAPAGRSPQVIETMVGAAGIEPATPTMST